MKLKITLLSLFLVAAATLRAQVDNYALQLTSGGKVTCGYLTELDGLNDFTIQFWMAPESWVKNAVMLSCGNAFQFSLGEAGTLQVALGSQTSTVTSEVLAAGQWNHVSLVVTAGSGKIFINNVEKGSISSSPLQTASAGELVLGGGTYSGRLDDIRIWKCVLSSDYDRFYNNTLNKWTPQWNDLLLYFKCDQELCDHLVDYKAIYSRSELNHHGVMHTGASKSKVTDNEGLPYLFNGAYCNNERFYDRAVGKEQYLLSNDLITLGISSFPDGHLRYKTPCNHATITNGTWLEEFEGRKGVLQLNGAGSSMECTKYALLPVIENGLAGAGYTFETWIYLDEWTEGAYLFKKTSSDMKHGFSIRLGADSTKQLIVRCDTDEYINVKSLKVGEWMHLGITTFQGMFARSTFLFAVNGEEHWADSKISSKNKWYTPTGMDTCMAYMGINLKGKLDETTIWNIRYGLSEIAGHMINGVPMPALGKSVTAATMKMANTYYRYDNPDNVGYDSYSQDCWRDIMKEAYKGYRGWRIRVSVEPHDGWLTTISTKARREIFARDLAKLSEGYDGVELDLEWDYVWDDYGKLAKAIHDSLPEGKTFQVSTHNVTYNFPPSKMQYVDGFTFQQYGPQKTHFYYSTFLDYVARFVKWGYPKDKIIVSYATTTSRGHDANGNAVTPISGVRTVFAGREFEPKTEVDEVVYNGYRYYVCGPLQTYKRAKYCVDNKLKGIFYWDMGNDLPVENKYNQARNASYGINANVDTLVTEVTVNYPTALEPVVAHASEPSLFIYPSGADGVRLSCSDGHTPVSATLMTLSGECIYPRIQSGCISTASLPQGVYLIMVETENGERIKTKWINHN